jgi:hypothetical protein
MSKVRRNKSIYKVGDNVRLDILTPDFSKPLPVPSEADLLRTEIALLRTRVAAQSHALKQINAAVRFVFNTFHEPLTPLFVNKKHLGEKRGR